MLYTLIDINFLTQRASEQKSEMEVLRQKQGEEAIKLEKRKKAIDIELSEIEPLIREAKDAVGNIKPDSLSEIRSLRMPPDVIRDILEAVLRLMGIFDTSWVSMKRYVFGVQYALSYNDVSNEPLLPFSLLRNIHVV